MSDLLRSFLAVPLPAEVKQRLGEAQRRLQAAAPEVKWVEPESFHITLKFLGSVSRERLQETWREVLAGLRGVQSFAIRLVGAGAFPSTNRARVVWVGIAEGAEELAHLARRTDGVCAACGFKPEGRPFQAHVTLGRVREPGPNPQLAAQLGELAAEDFGLAPVDRVLLMQSELTPRGAVYTILEQLLLEGGTGAE